MKQEQHYKVINDYLCIRMPQEIDHHNAEAISRNADRLICEREVNNIVFDFEQTSFMDSSGIGIIAGRYKKVQVFGGQVYIVNAGSRVKRLLLLSGLQKYVVWMKEGKEI